MTSKNKITIGVIYGGRGLEHQVDLMSSKQIQDSLRSDKYDVVMLGIGKDGYWYFSRDDDYLLDYHDVYNVRLDVTKPIVFPAPNGQLIDNRTHQCVAKVDIFFPITDDPVQAFLESLNVPYVGANPYGTAVGRDKDVTKRLLLQAGFPVVPYLVLRYDQRISYVEVAEKLGPSVFVKADRLGSSFGIYKATNEESFKQALEAAFTYCQKVLIEQAIEGREIGCAILGDKSPQAATALTEIIHNHEFFDFEAKYTGSHENALKIPAEVDPEVNRQICEMALEVFRLLECEGLARLDFFLKPDNTLLINEINTSPGLGQRLMYPKMWAESGLAYSDLMDALIDMAIQRFRDQSRLKH